MKRAIVAVACLGLAFGSAWAAETGTLMVSCGAGEYDVQVDGAVKGKCGEQISLSAGNHKVRVAMRGNQGEKVFQQQVAIEAGKTLAVTAEFRLASELDDTIGSPNFPPQKTLNEMQANDRKIKQIREQFRFNLKSEINRIVDEKNPRYLKLANEKKDEFESEAEFNARVTKAKADLDREQTKEFAAVQESLEGEYNRKIAPMIEDLKKLSGQMFTITSDNLSVEVGSYNAEYNAFPVSIKAKKPLEILLEEGRKSVQQRKQALTYEQQKLVKQGKAVQEIRNVIVQEPPKMKYIMLAANANIPLPRDEAREFKSHFLDNKLRAELKGNFETPENFTISEAKIIDDATLKSYSLYTSNFVDLGNGTVFDSNTKLLWLRDAYYFGRDIDCNSLHSNCKQEWNDAKNLCDSLNIGGMRGWRIPTELELVRMYSVYHKQEPSLFINIQDKSYWITPGKKGVSLKYRKASDISYAGNYTVWCVRGEATK